MATLAQRVEELLVQRGEPLDDDQIAAALGVRRQAVNQAARALASDGRIRRGGMVGSKIMNRALGDEAATMVKPPAPAPPVVVGAAAAVRSGRTFEEHARRHLERVWNLSLASKVVILRGGVRHSFDLVSPDESVVGDAKWFKDLKPIPAAKLSVIAEYVWLLKQHESAQRRFLVFGQDRAVPERWLRRFEPLLGGVEFWFLDGDGLDRLG